MCRDEYVKGMVIYDMHLFECDSDELVYIESIKIIKKQKTT